MYLNEFAAGADAFDMTGSAEFRSLLSSASDLNLSAPSDIRYVSRHVIVNGLRIHLLEWGAPTAPPLLLLHGGNQSAHSWDLVSLVLSSRYRILALDQRGHGDTEWPRDGEASRQAMAEDAVAVLDALDIQRPIVIGHSMGGIVAMTLLATAPGRARAAIIVDIGPVLPGQSEPRTGQQRIREFIRSAREFDSIQEFVERVSSYDPFRSKEHIRRTLIYNLMRTSDGKYVSKNDPRRIVDTPRVNDGLATRPTLADVSTVECPLLVIRGGESDVLTAADAAAFAAGVPDGHAITVPNCGHNVHSQNTAGFLEAITPFLSGES